MAGYEAPPYIDGCRSQNGRFQITAVATQRGKTSHGPNAWEFVWQDLEQGIINRFPAREIQGGQVYGQLYMAPDGETFAFWNHITMFWPEKSHMHASSHSDVLKRDKVDAKAWRQQTIFKNRLVIYRKDGTPVHVLHLADLLRDDSEWQAVLPVFNRVEWLRPWDGMNHKATARACHAFTRVSPDYSVLEFQVGDRKNPRVRRVSLIDGSILPADTELSKDRIPVRCFAGPKHVPKGGGAWGERYTPSLDPVREAGTYLIQSAEAEYPLDQAPKKLPKFEWGDMRLVSDEFTRADTPSWLPKPTGKKVAPRLVFTDLETGTLYQLVEPDAISELHVGATRGRVGRDKYWVGRYSNQLVRVNWMQPGAPEVLLKSGPNGRALSLNDLVISGSGKVYFTTLKDPEKGRLSMYDLETRELRVLFDGEIESTLANPNGIALDRHERFLYVGVSNYKSRKHSGVYAFPLTGDGGIDLALGRDKPRFPVRAPDGLAVDGQGNVYISAGNQVRVYTPWAQPLTQIKIPGGSATNLCFGGNGSVQKTLYVTTWKALYAVETPIGVK